MRVLLDDAAKTLKTRSIPARQSATAESNLDLAEQMWQFRAKDCAQPPVKNSPLALVMDRLAR
jgi:hypothetical protein